MLTKTLQNDFKTAVRLMLASRPQFRSHTVSISLARIYMHDIHDTSMRIRFLYHIIPPFRIPRLVVPTQIAHQYISTLLLPTLFYSIDFIISFVIYLIHPTLLLVYCACLSSCLVSYIADCWRTPSDSDSPLPSIRSSVHFSRDSCSYTAKSACTFSYSWVSLCSLGTLGYVLTCEVDFRSARIWTLDPIYLSLSRLYSPVLSLRESSI